MVVANEGSSSVFVASGAVHDAYNFSDPST